MGAYSIVAFAPVLADSRGKVSEKSLDYSLNNTARHALFLPTSREAKYKARRHRYPVRARRRFVVGSAGVRRNPPGVSDAWLRAFQLWLSLHCGSSL
jgi:hypothetical protein